MNINDTNYKINFGQLIPTAPFLKIATDNFKYEDAKILYKAVEGEKFPGFQGFANRSIKITQNILDKNKKIAQEIHQWKHLNNIELEEKISEFIEKNGEKIDLII